MKDVLQTEDQSNEYLSDFTNPFSSDKVEKITMEITRFDYMTKTTFTSQVRFCAGKTIGYHEIEAENFQSLVLNTESFIKSLDKEL